MAESGFTDFGLEDIFTNLEDLGKYQILIGYIGEKGSEIHPLAEIPVATLAAIQEFGTDDIPARPFIRSTFNEHQDEIAIFYALAITKIAVGNDLIDSLSEAAKEISNLVYKRMEKANSWAESLKDKTIEKKESNKILEETGTLKKNLGWAIMENNTIVSKGSAV